jgi:ferritin-like metal-binding protein YciE
MAESLHSLRDLFVAQLRDMYSAEHQIINALPKMIEAASAPELKQDFQQHLEVTREQAQRLERVFALLEMPAEEHFCEGMAGLLKEGEEMIQHDGSPMVRDAGLIAAAQKVEHYEIATYGTLRTFARTLGLDDAAGLLQKTLREESQTDTLLTQVAERSVNKRAA